MKPEPSAVTVPALRSLWSESDVYYEHRRRYSRAELTELCQRAEATGADSLWAVDHLFWPHPIDEALMRLTECYMTLGVIPEAQTAAENGPWPEPVVEMSAPTSTLR